MIQDDLYYGPPDADHYCAHQYGRRPGLHCPNHVEFYVKIPDGRGDDWRKGWAACGEHLTVVIFDMQEAHGGGGYYAGDYLLRAATPEETRET